MNSKINGVAGGPPRLDSNKPAGEAPSPGRATASTSAGTDELSLTGPAQLMVRLEKALEDVPAIDRERVETVKRAIADGNYAVDAERVAAEVLRFELDIRPR